MIVVYSNQPAKKVFLRDRYATKIVSGQPAGLVVTRDGAGNTIKHAYNTAKENMNQSQLYHNYASGNCRRAGSGNRSVCGSFDQGRLRGHFDTDKAGNFARDASTSVSTIFNVTGPEGVLGKLVCQGDTSNTGCGLRRVGRVRFEPITYDLQAPTQWVFIPDEGKDFFYEPYVYFGWWMNEAPPAGSEAFGVFYSAVDPVLYPTQFFSLNQTNNVEYHAVGANPARRATRRTSTNTLGSAIRGTATYEGGAAGRYAIRALGVENGSRSGDFVADVTLNVNFDADTPGGTADMNSIALSGAINNFRADHAGSNKWVVTLSADSNKTTTVADPFLSLADNTTGTAYTTKWGATGSSIPIGDGNWHVDFYSGANNAAPDAAGGRFVAGASNRSILMGAFGATKKTSGQ